MYCASYDANTVSSESQKDREYDMLLGGSRLTSLRGMSATKTLFF